MTSNWTMAAIFAVAAAALPTGAAADSASFTITVTIPPFAEAISARDSGAAGDWTILTPTGGFLVNLPELTQHDETGEAADATVAPAAAPLAVYRSDRNRFTLSVTGEAGDVALMPSGTVPGANLVRVDYLLQPATSTTVGIAPLRVVFTGL